MGRSHADSVVTRASFVVVFACLVGAAVVVSSAVRVHADQAWPLWAPAGLGAGVITTVCGRRGRALLVVALVATTVSAVVWLGCSTGLAVAFGLETAAAAMVFRLLVERRWPDVRSLASRAAAVHLFMAAVACSVVGASVFGVTTLALGVTVGDGSHVWLVHTIADTTGVVSLAPLALLAGGLSGVGRRARVELAGTAAALVLATQLGFDPRPLHGLAFPYAPLAVLLLAVVRLGWVGAVTLPPILVWLSLWQTALGHGPWAHIVSSPLGRVAAAQAYAVVALTVVWLIAGLLEERNSAQTLLADSNRRLEADVAARTIRLEEQTRRAQAAAAVSHALSQEQLDESGVMHTISREIAAVLGDVCSVRRLAEDGSLVAIAVHGRDEDFAQDYAHVMYPLVLSSSTAGLVGRSLAEGRVVRVGGGPARVNATAHPANHEFVTRTGIHSLMIAPMRAHGATVGSISLVRAVTPSEFTENDEQFLHDLADRAGLALASARLHAQVAGDARRSEVAAAVSHALSEARMDQASAMSAVSRHTADALGDACVVLQLAEDGDVLVPYAAHAADAALERAIRDSYFPLTFSGTSQGLTGQAIASGQVIRVGGTTTLFGAVAHPAVRETILTHGLHSALIAPMHADREVVGAMVVLRSHMPQQFSDRDADFLQDLADRAGYALANARLHATVVEQALENQRLYGAERDARLAAAESERRRREVLAEMLQAEEAERTRIATALHDDTVQVLAASLIALDQLAAAATSGNPERVTSTAKRARETLAEATERTRRLMFELRPTVLHDYGLVAASRVLLEQAARETGATTRLSGQVGRYHLVLEEALYRGVQEALANVRKHSHATEVAVAFEEHAGMLVCEVIDDGRGFDPSEARARPDAALHLGLSHVIERVRGAGGNVLVASAPGEGTHVRISIPVERRASGRHESHAGAHSPGAPRT